MHEKRSGAHIERTRALRPLCDDPNSGYQNNLEGTGEIQQTFAEEQFCWENFITVQKICYPGLEADKYFDVLSFFDMYSNFNNRGITYTATEILLLWEEKPAKSYFGFCETPYFSWTNT